MAFSSWRFGIFVAAAFAAYYLPAFTNFQVRLLVSASIFFYDYGQPELLPLPLAALPGTRLFLRPSGIALCGCRLQAAQPNA